MDLLGEMNYFYYRSSMYELRLMSENEYYNGLSYNSMMYLNVIEQMRHCTVSKLAGALKVTRSAATLKVNELVRQGAVVKTQSEDDKRVFYLRLSPGMERTVGVYTRIFKNMEGALLQKYTPEEMALFAKILHDISEQEWEKWNHE